MARKKAKHPYRALAVSLGVTLAMLTAGVYGLETLSWSAAGGRLIRPLLRLLGFILVGLMVAAPASTISAALARWWAAACG